jgi:hypothetical protein
MGTHSKHRGCHQYQRCDELLLSRLIEKGLVEAHFKSRLVVFNTELAQPLNTVELA